MSTVYEKIQPEGKVEERSALSVVLTPNKVLFEEPQCRELSAIGSAGSSR